MLLLYTGTQKGFGFESIAQIPGWCNTLNNYIQEWAQPDCAHDRWLGPLWIQIKHHSTGHARPSCLLNLYKNEHKDSEHSKGAEYDESCFAQRPMTECHHVSSQTLIYIHSSFFLTLHSFSTLFSIDNTHLRQ